MLTGYADERVVAEVQVRDSRHKDNDGRIPIVTLELQVTRY